MLFFRHSDSKTLFGTPTGSHSLCNKEDHTKFFHVLMYVEVGITFKTTRRENEFKEDVPGPRAVARDLIKLIEVYRILKTSKEHICTPL